MERDGSDNKWLSKATEKKKQVIIESEVGDLAALVEDFFKL